MSIVPVVPAQIRAGRALLNWSQEELAREAGVGLSSVRDIENAKRASDTGTIADVRRALENAGILFVAGEEDAGPGVRLGAGRPNIIRWPTTMASWDGMPFSVEWQGKEIVVFVHQETLDDLGRLSEQASDAVYVKVFEKHKGAILDGVRRAIPNPENFDRYGRLHLKWEHLRNV